MAMTPVTNGQIRIFISSTFLDMQEERKYLVEKLFPSLRRYCAERDVNVQEVDLRWGITSEDSRQGRVVDMCLTAIKKTQFFIGLLGGRYGWVPSTAEQETIKSTGAFNRYPWVKKEFENGASITEIEIKGGVLQLDEINPYAYFYHRSSAKNTSFEAIKEEEPNKIQRLESLKNDIGKRYRIKEFNTPEDLGALVEADFKALVEKLYPIEASSDMEKERMEQIAFLRNKTTVYIKPRSGFTDLNEFAAIKNRTTPSSRGLVITGKSGMGKSAMLANWIKERQGKKEKYTNETIIYHGIGQSRSEGIYQKIIAYLVYEINKVVFKEEDSKQAAVTQQDNDDELRESFQNLLHKIPQDQKLIIVLDGVDKLAADDDAKFMKWLPAITKTNVCFIFSTLEDDPTMAYFKRIGYKIAPIETLNENTIKSIIRQYLGSFEKDLDQTQVDLIAKDPETTNPLALCALLEELRMFGNYDELDIQINHYLKTDSIPDFFKLVLQRLEKTFGSDFVRKALSLIAVSRNGLTEIELIELTGSKKEQNQNWHYFYNAISSHVITINGFITFSHNYIREAVQAEYLSGSEKVYREMIINFLRPPKDEKYRVYDKLLWKLKFVYKTAGVKNRVYDEIPWQFAKIGDYSALYDFLLDWDVFEYFCEKNKYELGTYWRMLREKDNEKYSLKKFMTLDRSSIIIPKEQAQLFDWLSSFTRAFYFDYGLALDFANEALAIKKNLYENTQQLAIAESYTLIGYAYERIDNDQALKYHSDALEIYRTLLADDHRHTAIAYFNVGKCYLNIKENIVFVQRAADYLFYALELYNKLSHSEYRNIHDIYTCLSVLYTEKYGDPYMGVYYARKAIETAETTLGKNHPVLAPSYGAAAQSYRQIFKYEQARKYANYYLGINRLTFGENSPSTENARQLVASLDNENEATMKNNITLQDTINDELKAKELYLEAILKDPSSMDNIPEKIKTEEFCITAVQYNPQSFLRLSPEQRTLAVCRAVIEKDGFLGLKHTPNELKTYDVCLEAVKSRGEALIWTPGQHRQRELCLEASCHIANDEMRQIIIDIIPKNISDDTFYIEVAAKDEPRQAAEQKILASVQEDGHELRYVPDAQKTAEICLAAVRQNGQALQFVPVALRTEKICLAAVQRSGYIAFRDVPDAQKTEKVCLVAVQQSGLALEIAPYARKTEAVCLAAVKEDGSALQFVPDVRKTEAVCLAAVQRSGALALRYVPDTLKEKIKKETEKQ
jgi:hypothetical protein